jgi:hypothetical protein
MIFVKPYKVRKTKRLITKTRNKKSTKKRKEVSPGPITKKTPAVTDREG